MGIFFTTSIISNGTGLGSERGKSVFEAATRVGSLSSGLYLGAGGWDRPGGGRNTYTPEVG